MRSRRHGSTAAHRLPRTFLRQVESVIRRIDLDAESMKGWAAAFEERILPPEKVRSAGV
ncbi:MAG TPA: hypothetical protein VM285_08100 [Polyangia bacterium]|nr:hypothetical protein [Polyangia bacterium]